MDYYIIKAIHLIFVVSYFAGLFYLVRLFIYHTETQDKPSPDKEILQRQYQIMQHKLWNIITQPAGIITLLTGLYLAHIRNLWQTDWFWLKLSLIVGLIAYHFWCLKTLNQLKKNQFKLSSIQLRMMNELATILLFSIVFVVILKSYFWQHWYWILISFVALGALIMLIVRLVNHNKKN